MAEISIGNRRVQVPDDLDPKKPSTAAPQLRGNAFGDAAARTVAPGTVTPSLTGNPIAENPGMTGNPDNARFMKEAQMRVDPVQTAARNAAYAPERPAPYSKWSPFESEVRTGGNPGFGGGNTSPQADAWKFEQQVRNNPQMLRANNPTIAELPAAGGPKPSLRAGVAAEKSLLGKTAYAGGRMLAPVAKFATGVGGRALVGADVVGHFNDYKLNDPDVDSSASGTAAAFMQDRQEASDKGDWGGGRGFSRTRASLGKGLLETGMDLGGFVASTADLPFKVAGALGYKGDTSPVTQKYNQLLRDQFGDQLVVSGDQKKSSVAAQQPGGGAAPANAAKPGAVNAPSKPSAPIQFGPTDGPQQPEGLRTSVVRVGNSYSGPEGVGGDIRINNQAGRGTVTMMGGNPGDLTSAQRMAMDQRAHDIEMQSAGLRQQIMDRASGAPAPGAFILGGETQGSALRKQFDSTPSASILGRQGLSDRQRAADDRARAREALDERRMLMGDETQRRGQDIIGQGQMLQHGAQLRGQDMEYGGKVLQNQTAAARLNYDVQKGNRDFAETRRMNDNTIAASEQTQGNYARTNAAGEFKVFTPGKDGGPSVEDPGQSKRSYDAVRKILPGIDSMKESDRNALLPEAHALQSIFNRTYDQKQMGLDKLNPFERRGAERDSMPDFKGGVLKRQGLAGAITPGGAVGGYYIEHNGRDIPLGENLSERELEIIRHHLATGKWLGAPRNTEKGN